MPLTLAGLIETRSVGNERRVRLAPVDVLPGLRAPVKQPEWVGTFGVTAARSDYKDEVGWPALAHQVERLSRGDNVVLALNYGEAGALELFGHHLPPVASGHLTFRYWRPQVNGRNALLVGLTRQDARFCRGYRVVGRIAMPVDNEERRPSARPLHPPKRPRESVATNRRSLTLTGRVPIRRRTRLLGRGARHVRIDRPARRT